MGGTKQLTRRGFISFVGKFALVGATLTILGRSVIDQVRAEVKARRPPGAVSEALFSIVCLRCGRCAEVCPQKIIRLLPLSEGGLSNMNTPVLIDEGVCVRELACIEVCPSGALQKITSEEFKIGTAVIDDKKCVNCGLCIPTCREIVGAIKWKTPEKKKVYIEPDICLGCGACIPECPHDAISVSGVNARRMEFKW